jgi:hypothetical protein
VTLGVGVGVTLGVGVGVTTGVGVSLGVGVGVTTGVGVSLGVGVGITTGVGVGVGVGVGSVASSVKNTILPTLLERGNDCEVMLDCPVVIAPAVPLLAASPTTNG